MTLSQAKAALETRVGWKEDLTIEGFELSTANQTTLSGDFFQDQHNAITLLNIKECQNVLKITDVQFNNYLNDLRKICVSQVLEDAFEKDFLSDDLLTLYPSGFDKAIRLKMVILIGELIITAVRSNRTQRLNSNFAGKLNYDLYREAPNKFAIRGANYLHTLGVATKYGYELKSVQRRFGQDRNLIKTITKGQSVDESYIGKQYYWN